MEHRSSMASPHARFGTRALLLPWLFALVFGCAGTCPPFATLRVARADPAAAVQARLTINGQPQAVSEGSSDEDWQETVLAPGDVIETGPNTTATLVFANGGRAALLSGSKVKLGSLWSWFGQFFVSGPVKVKTKYVNASSEGTKYHVSVDGQGARVTVIEGRVRLSKDQSQLREGEAAWAPVSLRRGQRVLVAERATSPPAPQPVPPRELDSLSERFYRDFGATAANQSIALRDLRALPEAEAVAYLDGAALAFELTYEPSASDRIGRVMRQTPVAGTYQAGLGLSVHVTIGVAGKPVPNLIGQPRAEAEALLKAAGLALGEVRADGGPDALVSEQTPVFGSLACTDDRCARDAGRVDVVLSAPDAGDEAGALVDVPDVTGEAWSRAYASLTRAGLSAKIAGYELRPDLLEPRVLVQAPLARRKVKPDQVIEVMLAYPACSVPEVADLLEQSWPSGAELAAALRDRFEQSGLTVEVTHGPGTRFAFAQAIPPAGAPVVCTQPLHLTLQSLEEPSP